MDKFQTLHAIFNLVKEHPAHTTPLLQTNELLLRQDLPWDEVSRHLGELQEEGFIVLRQSPASVISLTAKGIDYLSASLT